MRWLSSAKRSCASRVMPCFSAMSSAPSPSATVHSSGIRGLVIRQPRAVDHICWCVAGKGRSGFCTTQGARVIDSTPPAMATEASPRAMEREAWMTASRPEPHSRLTVTPGTVTGRPASRTAIRATSRLSSPAPLASPKTTSSILAGSREGVRSTRARTTCAARSSGRTPAKAPPNLPIGVRTASTTYTSRTVRMLMASLLGGSVRAAAGRCRRRHRYAGHRLSTAPCGGGAAGRSGRSRESWQPRAVRSTRGGRPRRSSGRASR